jgi:hypothetical protein
MANYTKYAIAEDICGDLPICDGFVASPNNGLGCTAIGKWDAGGSPRAGGRAVIQFFSAPCPSTSIPYLAMMLPSAIQLPMCPILPEEGQEPDNTRWALSVTYFSTRESYQGTKAKFRAYGEITVPSQTELAISIQIDILKSDNEWSSWLSISRTINLTGPYGRFIGLNYGNSTDYFPITPSYLPLGIESYTLYAGIQPLIVACGYGFNDDTCGLYNATNDQYVTCMRGLITDNTNTLLPIPFLMATNTSNCGSPTTSYCYCDTCDTTTSPTFNCQLNNDPTFSDFLYTGFADENNATQQLQIGIGTYPLQIMAKTINDGNIFFYWRDISTGSAWQRSTGSQVQQFGPTIYQVSMGSYTTNFYFSRYPSPELVPDCPTQQMPFISEIKAPEIRKPLSQRISEKRIQSGCGCGSRNS